MKQVLKIVFLLFVYTITLNAQSTDNNTSEKVDSLMMYTKKIYSESKNNPLVGKKYGVEINPFLLLTFDKHHTITAGFSMFKQEQNAEISFPTIYDSSNNGREKLFSVDAHYRKFLGNTANGFYLSGLLRYAHLKGEVRYNKTESVNKLGLGFGIGYRIFSYSGFYWGVNLSFGRYLLGKNNQFKDFGINDEEFFVDGEILKFGYAF